MEKKLDDTDIKLKLYVEDKFYYLATDEKIYIHKGNDLYEEFMEYTMNNDENIIVKKLKAMIYPKSPDYIS